MHYDRAGLLKETPYFQKSTGSAPVAFQALILLFLSILYLSSWTWTPWEKRKIYIPVKKSKKKVERPRKDLHYHHPLVLLICKIYITFMINKILKYCQFLSLNKQNTTNK